jgi:integrase
MSNAIKIGRKQRHFINPATGKPVDGLSRMTDGRWRIIGTQTRFSEPDIAKAIATFRKLTGEDGYTQHDFIASQFRSQKAMSIDQWWEYAAKEIIEKPQWVAKKTRIEWLAYGTSLKPPEKLPTCAELRKLWETHAKCSIENMKQVRTAWDHFVDATGAQNLRDITPQLAIDYSDVLHASGYSAKTQAHMIAGIRRILSNAKGRAVAMTAINAALTYLELLKPTGEAEAPDPKPISVGDWHKLLAIANDQDRALVLLMLNGSFYLQEALNLEWDDIAANGCIVTNRKKTGKCIRVCVLWQETIDALTKLNRKGDRIFYSITGNPLTIHGAKWRFEDLVKAAHVKVTSSQLRDGAYTLFMACPSLRSLKHGESRRRRKQPTPNQSTSSNTARPTRITSAILPLPTLGVLNAGSPLPMQTSNGQQKAEMEWDRMPQDNVASNG